MRRFVPFLLAALIVTAGCAGPAATGPGAPAAEPAPAAAPPPETDPAKWTERVCDAMGPFVEFGKSQKPADYDDPAKAIPALKTQTADAEAAFGKTLTALGAVGPSPVSDGDKFVGTVSKYLTEFQGVFKEVNESVSVIDPADPAAEEKIKAALKPLSEINPSAADEEFGPDSEMVKQLEKSPKCKELGSLAG